MPASKRKLYTAEFQTRKKKRTEGWADLAEDLRLLADKAYSDLKLEAQERLALNQYLGQLSNPQVAFRVKQKRPTSLDDAVATLLELESYLTVGPTGVATVQDEEELVAVAQVRGRCHQDSDGIAGMLRTVLDRLERLEAAQSMASYQQQPNRQDTDPTLEHGEESGSSKQREPIVCRKCGKEGHYARGCAARCSLPPGN